MTTKTTMSRSEQVTQIIAEEIGIWSTKHTDAQGNDKIATAGALSQLFQYAGCPENVTRERLLADHKVKRARSRAFTLKDEKLDEIGRARAKLQMEVIVSIGSQIKQLDAV